MRLAFSALPCPESTLEHVVDAAERYGYEGVGVALPQHAELFRSRLDSRMA